MSLADTLTPPEFGTRDKCLDAVETPALVIDRSIMRANLGRMTDRARALGVPLRVHLKTPKSADVVSMLMSAGIDRFCTSTVAETLAFASSGQQDVFYAVPLDFRKIKRLVPAISAGARLSFLIDHPHAATLCATEAQRLGVVLRLFVEIDVDGYRTGMAAADTGLLPLVHFIDEHPYLRFAGLMSYAGASYARDPAGALDLAEKHRLALVNTKRRIEQSGVGCQILSFGSTPAVLHAKNLEGISEARCGIFLFQDLFQAGIGACNISDIAISVLTTVIGASKHKNQIVIDAGGLALSKDRSTQELDFDAGFGLIGNACTGQLIPDMFVKTVSQELGIVTTRSGNAIDFANFLIGSQLRILPNHADMTAAAYPGFHVIDGGDQVVGFWPRVNFW